MSANVKHWAVLAGFIIVAALIYTHFVSKVA